MAKTMTKAEKLESIRARVQGPFKKLDDGRVDCTFIHPVYGPIPFTADPNDSEEHGRLIHEIAVALTAN